MSKEANDEDLNATGPAAALEKESSPVAVAPALNQMDPNIRDIWRDAIELSEIRNVEDQTEFRSLRAQLGIDVSQVVTCNLWHRFSGSPLRHFHATTFADTWTGTIGLQSAIRDTAHSLRRRAFPAG